MKSSPLTVACLCGKVEIEASGRPIAAPICYCDDCQAAGEEIEAMPDSAPFRTNDGGTPYVVFRKGRVRYVHGQPLVTKLKLHGGSATNRGVARCCNSVMIMDFDDGKHWANIYSARIKGPVPKPEMLACTKFARKPPANPDGLPVFASYPPRLLIGLLKAKIAMLFFK